MGETMNQAAGTGAADSGHGVRHFDTHDADWVCLLDEKKVTAEPLVGRATDFLSKIHRASLLVEPADALSLYGVDCAPGFYIPTHHHDIDQFLLVIRGELRMGNHRFHPGHGAFMPAGNPYNVQFGRAGGCFLEFRDIPAFRTAYTVRDAPKAGPNAPTAIPGWSKPEGDKRKTVFFDAETCPTITCTGLGPGDLGRSAPAELAKALRYQALHLIPGDGYSMISVATDGALDFPRHCQDADKIIYVLSGEMRLRAGDKPLRPGAGVSVPAWTPLEISTGAAGVKYLEFRKQSGWHTDW